ncbi:MAG: sensor histidine kinase [Patescibacteria group bacterium]|jgi:signal transduction histidine kinase
MQKKDSPYLTSQAPLKRQSDFIDYTIHELKNSLTVISSFSQLLKKSLEKQGEPKMLLSVSKIESQIKIMAQQLDSYADALKLDFGNLDFVEEAFSLDEAVTEVVVDFKKSNPTYVFSIIGSTNRLVRADRYRIKQVVTTLLNQVIACSLENKKVVIKLATSSSKAKVSVCVFERVSPSDYQILGEKFAQAKTQPLSPETDVQLFLAHSVIEKYKGKLTLSSKEKGEIIFSFSLPMLVTD